MKRHYWQYLIDSAGNSVANARIHVFLANTSTYAYIYTTETGLPVTTELTEILTDSSGKFDFWIADKDTSPTYGYDYTQRFTITWTKAGLLTGGMTNIDIIWPVSSAIFQDVEFEETISIGASATATFELEDFCNRCLAYEVNVLPSVTSNFDLEIYRDNTFAASKLQYKLENVTAELNDKQPVYLKNLDLDSKLNVKVVNNGAACDITLTINYEKFA